MYIDFAKTHVFGKLFSKAMGNIIDLWMFPIRGIEILDNLAITVIKTDKKDFKFLSRKLPAYAKCLLQQYLSGIDFIDYGPSYFNQYLHVLIEGSTEDIQNRDGSHECLPRSASENKVKEFHDSILTGADYTCTLNHKWKGMVDGVLVFSKSREYCVFDTRVYGVPYYVFKTAVFEEALYAGKLDLNEIKFERITHTNLGKKKVDIWLNK